MLAVSTLSNTSNLSCRLIWQTMSSTKCLVWHVINFTLIPNGNKKSWRSASLCSK